MESHANEYELKHLQFHPSLILSFFFFLLLAVTKFPPALGLLPCSAGCFAGGFICWEGHVSWWWLSLSFSDSSDTNLDASVLPASLLCNMHPLRSINPCCNFIRISLLLSHTSSATFPLFSLSLSESMRQAIHQHPHWAWVFKNCFKNALAWIPWGGRDTAVVNRLMMMMCRVDSLTSLVSAFCMRATSFSLSEDSVTSYQQK